jgi:hypothetical protein
VLSLSTISAPTPLDDLKECKEYPWKTKNDEDTDEDNKEINENNEDTDEDEY